MTTSTSKTLAQTIATIQALDMTMIKFKTTRAEDGYGWSAEHAEAMELAYKRYLILHAKFPALTLAPDQDTDRFWHMHILDTRKYAADCDAAFGYFFHHFPYLGLRGEDDAKALQSAFTRMQRLCAQEFGGTTLSGEATTAAAWCGGEPGQAAAAWCGGEPGKAAAAWCGGEPATAQ